MARDLGEQEKAFIDALAADTGRDLAAWMSAIAASGHCARNDIIDWLRHQGFTFSNASWLERIHHNGGRLIYGGDEARAPVIERPAAARASKPPPAQAQPAQASMDAASQAQPSPAVEQQPTVEAPVLGSPPLTSEPQVATVTAANDPRASPDAEIAAILSAAKGLRPLADYVLREMDLVVPAMVRIAAEPFVTLASPMPFAALLPGPKEIRLFGDFGPKSRDRTRKAESTRIATPFPDVIVLNDARQIDDRLRELVGTAYSRALK